MKRISAGGRERSDLRHFHRRILPAGLLVAFLMAAVLMVAVQVSANNEKSGLTWQQLAQETGGYWQLVDTIPDPVRDEQKRVDTIRSGVLCATETNSLSEGSFTHQKEWYKGESFFPCEHNKFSNFAAVATWGRPPERITPGTTLSLEADVITTANDPGDWGSSLTLGITTDAPHTTCGYLTGGAKVVCSMIVSSHHEYEKEDCVLEVGAGRSEGEQFALRYCMAPSPCGYRYVYEWVPAEEKPADTGPQPPKPEPPKPESPKPDDSGTGTGVEGPSSSDSGSSSSGGSGSILGPLAVLGTLGALGGLAVLGGGAAIAIGIKVLGGGGGAAAAIPATGVLDNRVNIVEEVGDVIETTGVKDKHPKITREQLETEIQKELERLAEEGHFIGNKTLVHKGWNVLPQNWISNKIFGKTSNYCEEMKELGKAHLEKIMPEGTIIDEVKIQRNGLSNHIANKVILPDGTELVIDYWEGLANKKPATYTVEEWTAKWEKELGQPRWGRYQIHDVVSDGQKEIYEFILKNGFDKIDEFSSNMVTPEQTDAIKNWAKRQDWDKQETFKNIRKSLTSEQWEDWVNQNLIGKGSGTESGGVR